MQLSDVIDHFITKEGSYLDDKCRVDNGKFYYLGNLVAIKSKSGVLISSGVNQELSDALIYGLAKNGLSLQRVNLGSLTNYTARISDLEGGKIESFKQIADLYGMEYTEEEVNSFATATAFKERVKEFFERVHQQEAEERRKAEAAAMDAITRKAIEEWDLGKGSARDSRVKGEGGGLRLRRHDSGSKNYVYTSQGEKTTLSVVRKAWNFACQHWYLGKELQYGEATKSVSSGSYYSSGRSATVTKDTIAIGCQKVTKAEAERFAALQGWNKEGTN
jgi:hypothetical protein